MNQDDDHQRHAGDAHAGHQHQPASFGTAFAVGIGLNTAYVLVEAAFGFLSNSMALVADAGHNLSDVLGLAVAWLAVILSKRTPTARFTYGLRGSSILAALFNAVFLLVAVGAIGWEAVLRLINPEPVAGTTVMIVAAAGVLINGLTAWLFARGRQTDLNIRGAYLHMAADAAVSAGVVVAGLAIMVTGWFWLDAVATLAVIAVIVRLTWGQLRDSMAMSLAAVPPGVEPDAVRRLLSEWPAVAQLHDLHIWPMSTTEVALTAHLVMPSGHPGDAFLMQVAQTLKERFRIGHVTLQIETDAATGCMLEPDHVV
ncbi:MAG: cation diffusion facilitator family transporter [Pseudomonadota bacterium]|nr:cation diffusion facilitator family transporter [Pseudomonadota bacterium]